MGSVFKDYSKINVNTPQGYAAFMGCVKAAMNRPYRDLVQAKAKIRELATTGQFPDAINNLFQKFKVGQGEVDLSWMQVFDTVDLTSTNQSSYKIVDVQNGVTFGKVAPGEDVKFYSLAGQDFDITFDMYGAGLNFLNVWYDDQRWWDIEEATEDYNLAWWAKLATIMFGLIEAMPDGLYDGTTTGVDAGEGCNIKYDAGGSNTLEKDINTINAGILSLLNATETTLQTNANSPFVLMCNLSRYDRCRAAVQRRRGDSYQGPEVISSNITVVPTLSLSTADTWAATAGTVTTSEVPLGYLAIPGKKNKYIKRKELTIYPAEFKAKSYTTEIAAWGRFGGYANTAQFRRLLGSAAS